MNHTYHAFIATDCPRSQRNILVPLFTDVFPHQLPLHCMFLVRGRLCSRYHALRMFWALQDVVIRFLYRGTYLTPLLLLLEQLLPYHLGTCYCTRIAKEPDAEEGLPMSQGTPFHHPSYHPQLRPGKSAPVLCPPTGRHQTQIPIGA
jgi:hypothetical protein